MALAVASAGAVEGGRRGARGPAVGRDRARFPGRRAGRSPAAVWLRPGGLALGRGPRVALPARAWRRQPGVRTHLQPLAGGGRRPGDGRSGGLGPARSVRGDLGAVLADGRRRSRPRAVALAAVHWQLRAPGGRPLRRPAAPLARRPDAADGGRGTVEGPDPGAAVTVRRSEAEPNPAAREAA